MRSGGIDMGVGVRVAARDTKCGGFISGIGVPWSSDRL